MRHGDVKLLPFKGGENIAQFVAFAASVHDSTSSEEAIRRIGSQIGEHTAKVMSIRRVAAPLLGAGSGGLRVELAVSSLREGFRSTAHKDAALVISVLHRETFYRVRQNLFRARTATGRKERGRDSHGAARRAVDKPPRVFVSYSHTSPAQEKWVVALATFLRHNGVDARLDRWHLRQGMDLPQFMTNELTMANRVVLISDERYAEKADKRVGGVGWETMIVQGDMADRPPDNTKYIVVVRSASVDAGLPRYLKTKFFMHWPDATVESKNRRILLRELFDYIPIPALGPRPLSL